jgi:phenylalanyl-tRNA synthetase beta chain
MKFSENWLREWVNYALSTQEFVQQLTMTGLEVGGVEPVAIDFEKVVVGEIITVEPHPDAQKLHVCQVNVGEATPLSIVCGAANVAVGMRVPTALIGARLGQMKIKKTKLRGVPSQGMLCSAQELGLAESSEGLMALPADAPIGEDVREYLQLADVCIEVDLTPNRGDCLSIAGIAREASLLTNSEVTPPDFIQVAATIAETFPVELLNSKACPRYVGRVISQINPQATTPLWMQERLRRSGLRSISAVVDVTNYVMLELGQPMHAFDFTQLYGGIRVRMATVGESLVLLNGQTVALDESTLVIADHHRAVAMAGVMGGQESAVSDNTQTIFLESAFFTPKSVAGCARRYGLHTDSSHRFERGVDPQLPRQAMERATALLLAIVGGQAGPVIEAVAESHLPTVPTISLRSARVKRLLGQTIDNKEIIKLLTRIGMQVETPDFAVMQVQPPSFRLFDITEEADLIEEIARTYGYNQLPSQAPQGRLTMHTLPRVPMADLQAVLIQRDYQEAITYSFVDPRLQNLLNPNVSSITLTNPIASDMATMRTSLWTGLLQSLLYNQKRQQSRVRLFETGLCFINVDNELQQEASIAGLVMGERWPEQWGVKGESVDFFDIKADVEALLSLTGHRITDRFSFQPANHPALQPGQTAAVYYQAQEIGFLGALHPNLISVLELNAPVYLFELRLAPLLQRQMPLFQEISKFPSIRRDIAIVVAEAINAEQLINVIKKHATDLLLDWKLFDVYRGQGMAAGKKSLAIGLIFQSFSRNLIESEVDTIIEKIVNSLEHELDAQLRK